MSTPNIAIPTDVMNQLSALVAPVQGVGNMLTQLATSISSAVAGGATASGVVTPEAVVSPEGGEDAGSGQSIIGAGVSGFAEGLFTSINEQFSGFFTKLFGGEGEEGLFSSLGGLFGGGSSGDTPAEEEGKEKDASAVTKATGELAEDQKKQDEDRIKSDTNAWGKIVGNALAGSKKLRKIKKAMAIGSVIIDTAKGIAKAFGDHGFPGGLIPAALVAAKGAAQIAAIKGQAHDGLTNVPSTGTYLLEKGERVVGNKLNADLQGFLAAQASSPEGNRTNVNNSPSINLTINGDASEDAVASNRGALEGMIRDIFADYAMDAPFG